MPDAEDPAIHLRHLHVQRGGRMVLPDLSCRVSRGSITGLLGPSGCGKTTLMRSIVGVQQIHSGEITVLGREGGSRELRREVGYVTQTPSVYSDLTIEENARYFAAVYGVSRSAARNTILRVGLERHLHSLVGNLSGGERARASLACALLADPQLLILDEPTVGLDPVLRVELWEYFSELAHSGVTLLVSSHVMDEVARCDSLMLMRQGEILAHDTPTALLEQTGAVDIESAFLHLIESSSKEEQ